MRQDKKQWKSVTTIGSFFIEDLESVKRIVAQNPKSVNIPNHNGWAPLDIAISYAKLDVARFLFEKGGRPNLDAYHDGNETPVHSTAYDGKTANL